MAPDGTAVIEMPVREATHARRTVSAPPPAMPEDNAGCFVLPDPGTAASPQGRSARLPGVRYSFDTAAASSDATAAPGRPCRGAARFSTAPGIDDGIAAGSPRESTQPQPFNPWPDACQ